MQVAFMVFRVIARCMIWGVGCDNRSYASSTSAFVYDLLHCVHVLCDSALSRVTLGRLQHESLQKA